MSTTATSSDARPNRQPERSNAQDSAPAVRSFVQDINAPGQRPSDSGPSQTRDVPPNFTSNDALLKGFNDSQPGGKQQSTVSETAAAKEQRPAAETVAAKDQRSVPETVAAMEQTVAASPDGKLTRTLQNDVSRNGHNGSDKAAVSSRASDAPPATPDHPFKSGSPELNENRQRVLDDYNAKQPDAYLRQRFEKSMKDFEFRAGQTGLSDHEVAQTYKNVDGILTANHSYVDANNRNILASNIMDHAAHPENISQGQYGTCTATTIENRLFSSNPSIASDMVKQTALTGMYQTPDGQVVDVLKTGALIPKPESVDPYPGDGKRSFATQIMNNVILNDIYQRQDHPQTYVQYGKTDEKGKPLEFPDSGERLLNEDGTVVKDSRNPNQPNKTPGASWQGTADELYRLSGQEDLMLNYSPTRVRNWDGTHPDMYESRKDSQLGVVPTHEQTFKDESEFQNKLSENQSKGKMPIVLGVDGNDAALNGGQSPGSPAAHVLVIRAFDPKTNKAYVDNNWSRGRDGWVPVKDLYRAAVNAPRKRD